MLFFLRRIIQFIKNEKQIRKNNQINKGDDQKLKKVNGYDRTKTNKIDNPKISKKG
jgi:hypothetical protein